MLRFLCERHMGHKTRRLLTESGADVEMVGTSIHHHDTLIVRYANRHGRTIVTQDVGFSDRWLCGLDAGLVFVPQRFDHRPVLLQDCLPCLSLLLRSGLFDNLGHGVCTVLPDRVILRLRTGTTEHPIDSL